VLNGPGVNLFIEINKLKAKEYMIKNYKAYKA
jgi:hypothetical protein